MKYTISDRLMAGLTALGWTEDKNERSHYRSFVPGHGASASTKLFIGKAGALRRGECASRSHSIQHLPFYNELLAAGDKALADKPNRIPEAVKDYTQY